MKYTLREGFPWAKGQNSVNAPDYSLRGRIYTEIRDKISPVSIRQGTISLNLNWPRIRCFQNTHQEALLNWSRKGSSATNPTGV